MWFNDPLPRLTTALHPIFEKNVLILYNNLQLQQLTTINQKLNGTLPTDPLRKLLELLDTRVEGSVQWVLLEISWKLRLQVLSPSHYELLNCCTASPFGPPVDHSSLPAVWPQLLELPLTMREFAINFQPLPFPLTILWGNFTMFFPIFATFRHRKTIRDCHMTQLPGHCSPNLGCILTPESL